MKWKAKLSEFGLDENNVSQGLKTKIKDYYEIQNAIDELRKSLANPSINDDVDQLEDDLKECVETLEAYDNKLVKDVEYFNKHKDKYADMSKKLAEGRAKKKQANGGVVTKTTSTSPTTTTSTTTTENKEEKKGGGFGWVIFAVAVGVVTLGAVNLMKND